MSASFIGFALIAYFLLLLIVGYITGRKVSSSGYFMGNKQSLWWMVALGMLSDSMSGVSFISVPGAVNVAHWTYMQVVFGYLLGYLIIAYVLLPIYYKQNLTSIYSYLENRFGKLHQQIGAGFFVLSRLLGSAARLFLTAMILQLYLFDALHIPFAVSVVIIILLILAYTFKGGIRTLVFTDALQSLFLIGGVVVCVVGLMFSLEWFDLWWKGAAESPFSRIWNNEMSQMLEWNPMAKNYFWKHFLGGAAMCVVMTGLDQNMMQKNLSCKSLGDAQKNMVATGFVIVLVNMVFLSLGVLMHAYLQKFQMAIPEINGKVNSDAILPMLALQQPLHLFGWDWLVPLAFVLGLSAATFSSADSVLTTLTTSIYFDFLHLDKKSISEADKENYRKRLHMMFAGLLFMAILFFKWLNSTTLIDTVLMVASYTYGPLLGLFIIGIFTKKSPQGKAVLFWVLLAPVLVYIMKISDASGVWGAAKASSNLNFFDRAIQSLNPEGMPLFGNYVFGFEVLIINGLLVAAGLWLIAQIQTKKAQ